MNDVRCWQAAALSLALLAACSKKRETPPARPDAARSELTAPPDARTIDAPLEVPDDFDADLIDVSVGSPPKPKRLDAAHPSAVVRQIPFAAGRSAYVVLPAESSHPARLLAMIHGVCTPPSYVCGAWKGAASEVGLLVCPNGNATCGPDGTGAPTWEGPFSGIDEDLEHSIEVTKRVIPPRVDRSGAVLTGFSRGAYAAVIIAVRHPGRWPYLIINEADVELTLPMVRNAGVRAVALIAGEWGTELAGERRTVDALAKEGFPARLWVMTRVGHAYSTDIDAIMAEALEFVLSNGPPTPSPVP